MQNQAAFAHRAQLQTICVQSLVSLGKHQNKSHHPEIPILSFSWPGLKAKGNSTSVTRQCHRTAGISRVVVEKSGEEEPNSQRTAHPFKNGWADGGERPDEHLQQSVLLTPRQQTVTPGSHPGGSPSSCCMRVAGPKGTHSWSLVTQLPIHLQWLTCHRPPILEKMLGRKKMALSPSISRGIFNRIALFKKQKEQMVILGLFYGPVWRDFAFTLSLALSRC